MHSILIIKKIGVLLGGVVLAGAALGGASALFFNKEPAASDVTDWNQFDAGEKSVRRKSALEERLLQSGQFKALTVKVAASAVNGGSVSASSGGDETSSINGSEGGPPNVVSVSILDGETFVHTENETGAVAKLAVGEIAGDGWTVHEANLSSVAFKKGEELVVQHLFDQHSGS
ncbi:MAG: hypothetical protein AAF850_13310 [Pseudomonadota bacterium]